MYYNVNYKLLNSNQINQRGEKDECKTIFAFKNSFNFIPT